MKFTIAREALLKPLQIVGGVVEKRQTLPILSNVLVQGVGGTLRLTGTDLEVELTASVEQPGIEEGEITLPARKLTDICRALPEEAMLELQIEGERAVLRSGRSRFTLSTLPATEFPTVEEVRGAYGFTIERSTLKGLIDETQFCMANQDVRYYLNGLLLEVEGGILRAVATDGHRLALAEVEDEKVDATEKHQVIIPRKGVVELGRLLGDGGSSAEVQVSNNHVRVDLGETVLTSKLIDGRFPDYDRVIPTAGDKVVTADRLQLRQALVRASILSNEKYRGIRLQFAENKVRATVNNPEQEEAEEEVDVQYSGPEFEIGFNVSYLLEALNVIRQEEVQITLTDSNSSCLIEGVGYRGAKYVVMPMRL